jgi:phenylacetaldehyde dehydrogenase
MGVAKEPNNFNEQRLFPMLADLPVLPQTQAFVGRKLKMLIGEQWLDAASGNSMSFRNPATGEILGEVPSASAEDVDRAVQAARQAFDDSPWSRMRPRERQNLLWRLADLMERDAQELAELECLNNGKSAAVARVMDVQLAIDFLRYMAGWATKIEGTTLDVSMPLMPNDQFHGFIRREAVGVVGAIVAWNFPLLLACWKLGPALATGCTMVLKPADETPLTALKLAELVLEAGYPAGVLNVITGTGLNAGAALTRHPGVDKLTFTGSTEVGKQIGKAAMDNMTRVTLELGGKSPTIVMADANLQEAAAGAATAIFFNQGQVCCAGSRLYVQRKHFDNVIADIAGIANGMKLGNGLDPSVQMGPLISAKQQDRVTGYIELGRELGATIACGGEGFGPGYFVKPTVIVDVDQKHRLVQEEIFGPVLVAMPFDDIDDAVRMANDNPYGLGASIWSNDLSAVHRMIPRIKSGSVWVNCHSALDPALPFGGYKLSGVGREMGAAAIEHYTELKSVLIKL